MAENNHSFVPSEEQRAQMTELDGKLIRNHIIPVRYIQDLATIGIEVEGEVVQIYREHSKKPEATLIDVLKFLGEIDRTSSLWIDQRLFLGLVAGWVATLIA